MRAAVFKCVGEPLEIETRDDPVPSDGEVLLKIHRCGICGSDLHLTDRDLAPDLAAGTVLGHEYAGEIIAVGKNVENLVVGDRVAAMPMVGCGHCASCMIGEPVWCADVRPNLGGFAEFVATTPGSCIKLPRALSFSDGALVEPLSVALHAVLKASIAPGKKVLVMGAGPIGLGVLYWARRMGASKVTIVEKSPARVELAYAMGATLCVPPMSGQSDDEAVVFGGAGRDDLADIVFECVGKPGLLEQAIKLVRPRGVIVSVGFCMRPDHFVPAVAAVKEITLHFPMAWNLQDFHTSIDALDAGHVEPRQMITDVVSLDEAPAVFESLRGVSTKCKVLVAP